MSDESKTQLYRPAARCSSTSSGGSQVNAERWPGDTICRRRQQQNLHRTGRLSPARVCCNAFGLGLSYGISAASLLAIIFVFVELSSVRTELDVLRSELRKQQQQQLDGVDDVNTSQTDELGGVVAWTRSDNHKSDVRVAATSGSERRHGRHGLQVDRHYLHHHGRVDGSGRETDRRTSQLGVPEQDEDVARSNLFDDDQHGNDKPERANRKTKRSVAAHFHGRNPNNGRGITQDQVQQLIRQSTTMLYHPSAHMALQTPRNGSSFGEGNVLHWTEHHNSRLTHNQLFNYGESYSSLVVKTPGTYLIYVQITYNGRSVVRQPTCSHVVKLVPTESPNEPKSLLYGSITQYNQGRTIHTNADGGPVRAFDSVFQAGLFHLEIGDQLRVEMDDFSRTCQIKSSVDRTFFGALRVQPKDVD